jgi:hypothetical protein
MNAISRAELQLLGSRTAAVQVSLFMPAHRTGAREDPIRLRHWLAQAEAGLREHGLSAPEIERLLGPARQRAQDSGFWRQRGDGLAMFIGPEFLRILHLPLSFHEQLILAPRFFIRPLLPLLTGPGAYYILALNHDSVRLMACDGRDLRTLELPGLTGERAEALQTESPGKQVSPRVVGAAPAGGAHMPAMFYSSGGEIHVREQTVQFFHHIDKALHPYLRDAPAPLILAGVEHLTALFRETSRTPGLVNEGIAGNADALDGRTLQARARQVLEAERLGRRDAALAHYQHLAGSRRATHDIRAIVPAACQRRVETLFVEADRLLWGRFDPSAQTAAVHHDGPRPGDEDLLNLAVIETLWHGGEVWPVAAEMLPGGEPAAAILGD